MTARAETPPRRRPGRPRRTQTLVVNVRMEVDVYDAYCVTAGRACVPIRTVLREVLKLHAPRVEAGDFMRVRMKRR